MRGTGRGSQEAPNTRGAYHGISAQTWGTGQRAVRATEIWKAPWTCGMDVGSCPQLLSTAWLGTLPGSLLFSFWPERQKAGWEDEGWISQEIPDLGSLAFLEAARHQLQLTAALPPPQQIRFPGFDAVRGTDGQKELLSPEWTVHL